MNKMHTIQDVKQRIHELIQKEIAKCNKEIEEFEHKISDNAIVYGGGGWCTQFEKAKKRRLRRNCNVPYMREKNIQGERRRSNESSAWQQAS